MMGYGIKFRPNKPASSHLVGKVERSQRSDKEEFYPTVGLNLKSVTDTLSEWHFYYNWQRTHGSLSGITPAEKAIRLSDKIPFQEDVSNGYVIENERIRVSNN